VEMGMEKGGVGASGTHSQAISA